MMDDSPLLARARDIVVIGEPGYSTDDEYEQTCIGTQKSKPAKKEPVPKDGRRLRGENRKTIQKEEGGKT